MTVSEVINNSKTSDQIKIWKMCSGFKYVGEVIDTPQELYESTVIRIWHWKNQMTVIIL